MGGFAERLLLFLLGCLLCLLCFLRFLGHVALRDPKSWLNASRPSTCMHSPYTTIENLILRVSKKVNDRRAVATTAKRRASHRRKSCWCLPMRRSMSDHWDQ